MKFTGFIHLFVNGHFVNHYRDGIDMNVEDLAVNEMVNIKGIDYLVKRVQPLVVGPRALPVTYVYVEE